MGSLANDIEWAHRPVVKHALWVLLLVHRLRWLVCLDRTVLWCPDHQVHFAWFQWHEGRGDRNDLILGSPTVVLVLRGVLLDTKLESCGPHQALI